MKVLFIGAVNFSARVLQELVALKVDIVGVCTTSNSSINSDHCDLSPIADEARIPLRYTKDINSLDSLAWIRKCNPDIIFCFGWSQLIKKPLLKIPPMGIVGYHPTALPSNRGRHPLIWAIVLGLTETASTFFFMDEGADSGDILSQKAVSISFEDDATSLYERVVISAISQIREFLPLLVENRYVLYPQDNRKANVWRKRTIPDGIIDWRMSAVSIYNLIRGLTHPYVGAQFLHRGNTFIVWRSQLVNNTPINEEPGKVLDVNNDFVLVKAGEGAIRLFDITPKIDLCKGDYL